MSVDILYHESGTIIDDALLQDTIMGQHRLAYCSDGGGIQASGKRMPFSSLTCLSWFVITLKRYSLPLEL